MSYPFSLSSRHYFIAILLAVFFVSSSHAAVSEHKTILVLGDSLSAGYNMPLEKGWVNLLRQKLQQQDPEVQIINASISGDTTGQGLARLKPLLEKHQPDLVILELGGNDGLRGIAPPLIKRNLARMIDMSKEVGAEVLLLGMQILPNYGKRYAEAFQKNYQELAQEKDVELVPSFLKGVGGKDELMQKDGIHPNEKAQPILLENLYPFLIAE